MTKTLGRPILCVLTVAPIAFVTCSVDGAQDSSLRLEGSVQYGAGGSPEGIDGDCHHGWAACGVWHHDQKAKGKYRLAAMDCYPALGRALDLEDEAYEINQQMSGAFGEERSRLVDEFNRKIGERGAALREHRDCITEWYGAHRVPPEPTPARQVESGDPVNTAGTPGNASWAQKLDQALGSIPYLHETDRFLEEISDYDMTKPHTGAKIMAESIAGLLGEAGFSYLIKGLPKGVAASPVTQAAEEASAGAGLAGGQAGNAAAATRTASRATDTAGGATGASGGRRLGNPGKEALEEVGPPPRHQPARSKYTDTEPPMHSPQGERRYPHFDAPPPPTSVGEAIIADQVWAAQLPAGTGIPAAIRNSPRPVYLQESTHSCVLACSRMISETHLGNALTEESLSRISGNIGNPYVPGAGTWEHRMQEVLWEGAGIRSRYANNIGIDELAAATAQGHPAMVGLKGEHAVVVDGIIDSPRGPMVLVRDPANLGLLHSDLARDNAIRAGFSNAPAIPLKEFMADYFVPGTQGGVALLTNPL